MHIGNLRTALFAYLYSKSQNGDFILRIEDTDQERYVDGAIEVIYDTLRTSRLIHDEGPDIGGSFGPYVQSERKDCYRKYAEYLVSIGKAYYCFCGKDENIDSKSGYNRHCRNLSQPEIKALLDSGKPYVIRQKVPVNGCTSWNDLVYGTISVENRTLDDQILLKSDGMPTYNFANVVDDHLMGITHIIRGSEYLSSNPKYILLYNDFGWDVPDFIHLPLINGKDDEGNVSKLSKRHGAVSFQALVDDGYLPEAIVNYIALLGWSPKSDREIFTLDDLVKEFSIDGVHKNPAIFDYRKLDWVNSQHIQMMPESDFAAEAAKYTDVTSGAPASKWNKIASLLKPRINKFSEVGSKINFIKSVGHYDISLYDNKKNKVTRDNAVNVLTAAADRLSDAGDWNEQVLFEILKGLADNMGIKIGQLLWPLRIALSGLPVTPGGVTDLLEILGKEESLLRISNAVSLLKSKAN